MNPIAFTIFGYNIRYYSMFILLGVFLGYILINKETKKIKLSSDTTFNIFFWTLIIGILGARLYYVVFNWEYFGYHINEIWQIWQGGLAIHGGIIAGIITLYILCRKENINYLKMLDILCVPLILAQSIGRWGNFFNQEAYGSATTLMHLQNLHVPNFIINGMNINGIYYTPTFYYESIWCFIGFIVLYLIRKQKFTKIGQTSAIYLIWYGIGRFFIEALRTDSLTFIGFKMAQLVSIFMIVIGVIILLKCLKKGKYEDLYSKISK